MENNKKTEEKVVVETTVGDVKNENVTLTKEQFDSLMGRLNRIEKGETVSKVSRITDRTANVRIFEGLPVVGIKKTFSKRNEDNKEMLMCTILVNNDGKVEEKEVNYLDFLNNCPAEMVKIIKQTAIPTTISHGFTRAKNAANDTFGNDSVELLVNSVDYESEIEFMNGEFAGKVMNVSNKCFNI